MSDAFGDRRSYYEPIWKNNPQLSNAAAQRIYFEETEPGALPSHNRVLHLGKAQTIADLMVARLMMDLTKNSRLAWKPGTPLQGKNSKIQPLAEDETKVLEI